MANSLEVQDRAQISIEVGAHFYAKHWLKILALDPKAIPKQEMEHARMYYNWQVKEYGASAVSTCAFMDGRLLDGVITPAEAVKLLQKCAKENGLPLHYVGSEGGFLRNLPYAAYSLADYVLGHVIYPPMPGANGSEPSSASMEWLSNGVLPHCEDRSEGKNSASFVPGQEYDETVADDIAFATRLFKDNKAKNKQVNRDWACAHLSASWVLSRLGLLRSAGFEIATEFDPNSSWEDFPTVLRLGGDDTPPFEAERTHTIQHLGGEDPLKVATAEAFILQCLDFPNLYDVAGLDAPPNLCALVENTFIGRRWL